MHPLYRQPHGDAAGGGATRVGAGRGATARARLLARLVGRRRATQPASRRAISRTCTPPRMPVGSTRRAWSMPDCHLLLETRTRELTSHPAHARVARSPWREVRLTYPPRYERRERGASAPHEARAPTSSLKTFISWRFSPFGRLHLPGVRACRALVGSGSGGMDGGHVECVHAGGRVAQSHRRGYPGLEWQNAFATRGGSPRPPHYRPATTSRAPTHPTGSTARPGGSVPTPPARKAHRKKTRPPPCMQSLDIGSGSGGIVGPRTHD